MIKSMKRALRRTAIAGVIGLVASQASAFALYPNDVTLFEDNDIERLINANGGADTTLDVGDRLRGVLTIDGLSAKSGLFPAQALMGGFSSRLGDEEITGIFEVEVKTVTTRRVQLVVDGVPQFNPDGTAVLITVYDFTFGASTDAAWVAQYGAKTAITFYNQAAGDLVLITDPSSCDKGVNDCEAKATNGTKLFSFGFSDLDAQWDAKGVASNDVAIIAAGDANGNFGSYNFALGLEGPTNPYNLALQNMVCAPSVFTCAGDGKAELIGSGSIEGGVNLQNGWDARSDFQFGIRAIPEPGSLALAGLALAGLGAMTRRRKA